MKKFGPIRQERHAPGAAVKAEAAAWSDRLREGGDDTALRRDFERWRAADPERAEIFDSVDRSYRTAREAVADSPLLQAMHERTRAHVAERRRRGRQRLAAVAAAVVASVGLGLFVAAGGSWQELQYMGDRARYALMGETLYRTAVGERLAVTLDDGTVLTLNTDSRVIVDFGEETRNIRQVHGQTLFEVARDKTRPFVVEAGSHRVTALGTAFDVRLTGDRFEVTLIEGRVKVEKDEPDVEQPSPTPSPASGGGPGWGPQTTGHKPQPTILIPGEQLVALAAAEPIVRPADVHRAISWRHGQLIFQNDPLAEAVAEFNRYGGRRIVLADDSLGALPISGAFRTGNTAGFIATVSSYFGLQIVERNADRIVLARRQG